MDYASGNSGVADKGDYIDLCINKKEVRLSIYLIIRSVDPSSLKLTSHDQKS